MISQTGSDSIAQQIEAVIPTSLDDIFRKNKHWGSVTIATEDQLHQLHQPVPKRFESRGDIDDWRFIAITFNIEEKGFYQQRLHLFGSLAGESWITSMVQGIDMKSRLVRTKNSVYGLAGEPGTGELDSMELVYLCGAFNRWGYGEIFGIPPVFF